LRRTALIPRFTSSISNIKPILSTFRKLYAAATSVVRKARNAERKRLTTRREDFADVLYFKNKRPKRTSWLWSKTGFSLSESFRAPICSELATGNVGSRLNSESFDSLAPAHFGLSA